MPRGDRRFMGGRMTERDPAQSSANGLATWRRRTVAKAIAGLGAGVATMLSLGVAAYGLAQPDPVPEVGAKTEVDAGRWGFAVYGARFVKARPDAAFFPDRSDSLQVEMRVTNLSAGSDNTFARLLRADPPLPAEAGTPTFKLARDEALVGYIHPNLPENIVAYWKWPEGKALPQNLVFVVDGEFFKPRDNLYGAPGWFPTDQPAARITVPVESAGAGG